MFLLRNYILFIIIVFTCLLTFCNTKQIEKKKVVYINSYHRGHPSSDEVMDAILGKFPADSFDLKYFYMDTKRNTSQDYIERKAAALTDSILAFQPEVLIVSDDNAVKYIVQPNLDRLDIPVVFCGVNWTANEYQLPPDQVTGMLEILPVGQVIRILLYVDPSIERMFALSENTTTSRKEAMLFDTLFADLGISVKNALVDDFEEWKVAFRDANNTHDIIYIPTHGGVKNWDHEAAKKYVKEHMRVPVLTCEDFMMPYCVFGMTKIASEQGDWAANTAKKILNGQTPTNFPVVSNKLYTTWINRELASLIGFEVDTKNLSSLKYVVP